VVQRVAGSPNGQALGQQVSTSAMGAGKPNLHPAANAQPRMRTASTTSNGNVNMNGNANGSYGVKRDAAGFQ
jgi:hypothetical protein